MKLARLRHILAVFGRYGFDDLLARSGIAKFLPHRPRLRRTGTEASRYSARNLRLALEELGPTFTRPDAGRLIEQDISILYKIADLLDKHSGWAGFYSFVAFIREFERLLTDELDFKKEGANIIRLAANLKHFEHIHLPKVYWPYSTGKVLALERIRGERLSPELPSGEFVSRAHLAEEIVQDMGEMLLSFANQDAGKITGVMLEIGAPTEETDTKALEQDIRAITSRYSGLTAADLSIGRAIVDLAKASLDHVPQSFNLLGKTLFYMDVIIKQLAPDIKYMDFMRRSTQRVFANLWQSQYSISRFTEAALETNRLILDSPGRLNILLDKLVKNEVTIRFEHEHLDGLIKTLRQGANRLAYAVVVASIIVGSALIMRLRTGQEFFGYSFLGVMGFLVAGLLGVYLLIRILRTERL